MQTKTTEKWIGGADGVEKSYPTKYAERHWRRTFKVYPLGGSSI